MEARAPLHSEQPLALSRNEMHAAYRAVRSRSEQICAPLAVEDYLIQPMTEASPPKWHLAHVSWFFETFLLKPFLADYRPIDPRYEYLFNSYYDSVGAQWPRPQRGLLSRPTVAEVYAFRSHVDEAMARLIDSAPEEGFDELARRLALGLNHEQQHQELLLTDLKYAFSLNPLVPIYAAAPLAPLVPPEPLEWVAIAGGEGLIGHAGAGFCYDNEGPCHRVLIAPFQLATRPVSSGEYVAFIDDGGYQRPELWLSDGWARVRQEGWQAPLYWRLQEGQWQQFTLAGLRPLDPAAPVCHLSFYEADAYARWADARLPTEQEWEHVAAKGVVSGNFYESGLLAPRAESGSGVRQLFGDVWEWTASPYLPYPGYQRAAGAFGEYNGKFMCNQMVLRGGSCVTPADHIRPTYRNFFYPHERWQFSGVRLAR